MVSVVQTAYSTASPPDTLTFGSPLTPGNAVFLVGCSYTVNGSDTTSSNPLLGGSSVPGAAAFFNSGSTNGINNASGSDIGYITFWMLPNVAGGETTAALSFNVDGMLGLVAYEVSGLGSTPALDQSSSGSSLVAATASSGASGNITGAYEFILGGAMMFSGAGAGQPSGFTYVNPTGDVWVGYQIANSSGGSYTWSQSSAGTPWVSGIVTVKMPGTAHTATAALAVTPSFSAARTRAKFRTAALTVTPSFSVARVLAHVRHAALTVTPSFSAARTRGKYRTASLTVPPSFSAARTRAKFRTAALTVTPTFSAARVVAHVRHAALTVTPSFFAHGINGSGIAAIFAAGGARLQWAVSRVRNR